MRTGRSEMAIRYSIEHLNKMRNVAFCGSTEDGLQYRCTVDLKTGEHAIILLIFQKSFPLTLPEIYIQDPLKKHIHTDSKGKICYFDSSSVLFDLEKPELILLDCYDKAIENLNASIETSYYKGELKKEFNAYWLENAKHQIVWTRKIDKSACCIAKILLANGKSVISESEFDAKAFAENVLRIEPGNAWASSIIIPLRRGAPLPHIKAAYKWSEVRHYITANVTSSVKRQFERYIDAKSYAWRCYLILIVEDGDASIIFGFWVSMSCKRKVKIANMVFNQIEPVYVKRCDQEYLLKRCGANMEISKKGVLLLGCGSVGGFIANNLCQIGVGYLDILDKDIFTVENVHRHFLGIDMLNGKKNAYKADLVQQKLQEMYPYAEVSSLRLVDRQVETFIQDVQRLQSYDLIISALGEPTINLALSKTLIENKIKTPLMCCFNEPYGIGGHIVVSNLTSSSCLRCMYTDVLSTDIVSFRGSFVEAGQSFKKNLSGCGGSYVPYSALDSQQTALIATRVAADVLTGKLSSNKVFSWRGSEGLVTSNGFETSGFFSRLKKRDKNYIEYPLEPNAQCPICHCKQDY